MGWMIKIVHSTHTCGGFCSTESVAWVLICLVESRSCVWFGISVKVNTKLSLKQSEIQFEVIDIQGTVWRCTRT